MKPMIIFPTILIIFFRLAVPGLAQDPPEDPFGGGFPINQDFEIFTMGTQNDSLHGWGFNWIPDLDIIQLEGDGSFPQSYQCGDKRDIAVADFNGDFVDELVVAWNRDDDGIFVGIPTIDTITLKPDPAGWHYPYVSIAPGVLYATDTLADLLGEIRVVAGNFYDDPAMEFVLAYLAADSTVTLSVFDVDTMTSIPGEMATISDQALNTQVPHKQQLDKICRFDLATGDFDGDGTDEIILVVNDPAQSPATDIIIATYDYDTSGHAIIPVDKLPFTANSSLDHICLRRLAVATGNFDADPLNEISVMDRWAGEAKDPPSVGTIHILALNSEMTAIDNVQEDALPPVPHWSPVKGETNAQVRALTVFDDMLFAGGEFTYAGGAAANRIADCYFWSPMDSGMNGNVVALTVYDGKLIAGGRFTTAGGNAVWFFASWDGSSWIAKPDSTPNRIAPNVFTVYDGKLIAASYQWFEVSAWDGLSWSTLGSPGIRDVRALAVYDGKLIAGGSFEYADGTKVYGIAAWDGIKWDSLGSGMIPVFIHALTVYDNKLIAGGYFTTAGGVAANKIAAWDGSSWSPLGSGISDGRVDALTVYNNKLIAGGTFTTAGGTEANYIAAWDGLNWSNVDGPVRELPMSLTTGNIDQNEPTDTIITDELFITGCREYEGNMGQYVKGYAFDTSSVPATLCETFDTTIVELILDGKFPGRLYTSRRIMAIDDVTGEGWPDLTILLSDNTDTTIIGVIELYPDTNSVCAVDSVITKGTWATGSDDMSELVLADLDNSTTTIGPPKAYQVDSLIQPLAIINAPPVHYDIFDDTIWDVSERYPINDIDPQMDTYVEYYNSEAWQITTETEMYRDWGISEGLEKWIDLGGSSVSNYLTNKYGERFSKQCGYSEKITVGQTITARSDDQLRAVSVNYNILEYPVFHSGELVGHVLTVSPSREISGWSDADSYKYFMPNHEVDNIFSYPSFEDILDNPMMASGIIGSSTNYLTMQGGSGSQWYLGYSTFQGSSVSESWDVSRAEGETGGLAIENDIILFGIMRIHFSIGFKASFDENYGLGQISTFSTSFSQKDSLHMQMGMINSGSVTSSEDRRYRVIPYAYWANNGALIIDYAVQPEIHEQGENPSWWQVHYSNPDPAFILPWRFDNEKLGGTSAEEDRHQTKEIFFYPTNPAPGDSVVIAARVHNFSLSTTLKEVAVSFYLGNPVNGGVILKDKNSGDSIFYTRDTLGALVHIEAQGNAFTSMVWQVPYEGDISSCQRIWAVIDPLDDIKPEVHDNRGWATNNKGWKLLYVNTDPICVDTDGDDWADPAYRCHICPHQEGWDNCPTNYNPDQADSNGNGIGDACEWICGDANGDDEANVGDVVYLVNYIFRSLDCDINPPIGCPPEFISAADANGDASVNVGDVVYLNNFIFKSLQCATNPPIGCPPTCGL